MIAIRLARLALLLGFTSIASSVRVEENDADQQTLPGPSQMVFVQANVFEDGLASTPGNTGFDADFHAAGDELFSVLGDDGTGKLFEGFEQTRRFGALPEVVHLNSLSKVMQLIDTAYNALYHVTGGQVKYTGELLTNPLQSPEIGGSLRNLFLGAHLQDKESAPSDSNPWVIKDVFQESLRTSFGAAMDEGNSTAVTVKNVLERMVYGAGYEDGNGGSGGAFQGDSFAWSIADLIQFKKRDTVVADHMLKNLEPFRAALKNSRESSPALTLFLKTSDGSGAQMDTIIEIEEDPESQPDPNGNKKVTRIRTKTFLSALWLLIQKLCVHSSLNPKFTEAIVAFTQTEVTPGTALTSASGAALVFKKLADKVNEWSANSVLSKRHIKFVEMLGEQEPTIATLVEYDKEWRKLSLPSQYGRAVGAGTAVVIYDKNKYTNTSSFKGGYHIPEKIVDGVPAKSNAIVLLQPSYGVNLPVTLAVAVHFESGRGEKAKEKRKQQMDSTLVAIAEIVGEIAGSVPGGLTVLLAGDFNGAAEEFKAPEASPSDVLTLHVSPSETNNLAAPFSLTEVSRVGQGVDKKEATTRAGSAKVIDFIFMANIGYDGAAPEAAPKVVALAEDMKKSVACIKYAVDKFGSDHLPIAVTVSYGAVQSE